MENQKRSFEQNLARLDEIVRALESGEETLENSIALYTEGARLIGNCSKELEQAEQTVVRLQKTANGTPEEVPFDAESEA